MLFRSRDFILHGFVLQGFSQVICRYMLIDEPKAVVEYRIESALNIIERLCFDPVIINRIEVVQIAHDLRGVIPSVSHDGVAVSAMPVYSFRLEVSVPVFLYIAPVEQIVLVQLPF